jgi:glutamine cyclotransferase
MIKYLTLLALFPFYQSGIVGTYVKKEGDSGMDGDSRDWTLTLVPSGTFKYHFHEFKSLSNYDFNTEGRWYIKDDLITLIASKDGMFITLVAKSDKLIVSPYLQGINYSSNMHNLDTLRRVDN